MRHKLPWDFEIQTDHIISARRPELIIINKNERPCRIVDHRIKLKECENSPPEDCHIYNTKQPDGEVPVMLELWGMRSTTSFSSLPGPLWPGVVAPDRVLSMGQIELNCELLLN